MNTIVSINKTQDRAIAYTMRWEGGYIDHPDDPGGATNHGISLRFLKAEETIEAYDYDGDGDVDADDVKAMTKEQAAQIYRDRFWGPALNTLPELVAIKVFDFTVNMGPGQLTKLLQRTLNDYLFLIKPEPPRLIVDGAWGPATSQALRSMPEHVFAATFLDDLEERAARFYFELAEKRPTSRTFLFGWLRRCYARPEL